MSEFDEVIDTATADGEIATESTEQVETGDAAQIEQETVQETPQERHERMFGQADVDRILQTRLAKEKQRFENELKSNPRLTYLEELAKESGMSVDQLIDNDKKYRERQKINQLIQQNIPPELAQEIYEGRKFREETKAEREARQKQESQQEMYSDFLKEYPEFQDPQKANEIPPEVWQMVDKGEKLLNAYARYENQRLKAEMAKVQQQQQTQQANLNNAATSTGSVKDGGKGGEFISADEFEANRHDQSWVMKNYSRIQKSRAKW